jgi:SAM-dependent methyltransferase
MTFANAYADPTYARAYASMDFPGTYHLVARDLPAILLRSAPGRRALDFGCGAGRTTRLLRDLGFDAVGVDIASAMLALARAADPDGDYRLLLEGDAAPPLPGPQDLVLCGWPFDNTPGEPLKVGLLSAIREVLAPGGRVVNVVSRPEIYRHEWASFSTADFPGNARARSGDVVRIVGRSVPDARPVDDILWSPRAWRATYDEAGLRLLADHQPLARGDEGVHWVTETAIPPWSIHVLQAEEPCSC